MTVVVSGGGGGGVASVCGVGIAGVGVGVGTVEDDGQTDWRDWRQRDAESGSEYGRRSCGKLAHEWLARSLARQVCAKSRGRSGQRTSSSSSNDQNPLQLPTGHAVLETSVSSTRQSYICSPLGHGESNRRCTLQVETRDVDAGTPLYLRVFPAAAIPGFNPACPLHRSFMSHIA